MRIRPRIRTRALALTAAAALTAALAVAIQPASAGASGGDGGALLMKQLGSRYTDASFLSGVGRPGKTVTFQLELTNTTGDSLSFDLNLNTSAEDPVSWGFYDHHHFYPGPEYQTQTIADGGTLLLSVVAIPDMSAEPGADYQAELTMNPDGDSETVLADKYLQVSMVAPPIGTGGMLFVQAAGQATVGGNDEFFGAASSTALVAPKSTTYKITLVNNSGDTSNLSLYAIDQTDGWCDDSFLDTFKVGGFNVTGDVFGSGYESPLVPAGATLTVNLTVKYTSDTGCCNAQDLILLASDGLDEAEGGAVTPIAYQPV